MRPIKSLVKPTVPACSGSPPLTDAAQLEQFMRLLGARFVLYYPVLAKVCASANAALMLGHMLYWSRTYLHKHPERGGWMWCTAAEWTDATGLSRHEQDTARAALKETGCVEERLVGVPAKMHYRVNLDVLGHKIARHLEQSFAGWAWEDQVVRGLLGYPIAYQRVFAEVTGSSIAALYLSDLCQLRKSMNNARNRADVDGEWMELPLGVSASRLGRSAKSLRTARNVLIALRMIEERSSRGVQPKIQTRICLSQIMRLVGEKLKNTQKQTQIIDSKGMAETYIPDVPKPANWDGGNVHSRCAETGKLEVPKPANKIAGNVTSINRFTTTKVFSSKQLPLQASPDTAQALSSRCGGSGDEKEKDQTQPTQARPTASLVEFPRPLLTEKEKPVQPVQQTQAYQVLLPKWIDPLIAENARKAVAGLSETLQQDVLDEWVGKLKRQQGGVSNQLGYLHGIVRNADRGTFVPTLGIEVAAARKRAEQSAQAMEQARAKSPVPVSTVVETEKATGAEKTRGGIPAEHLIAWKKLGVLKR